MVVREPFSFPSWEEDPGRGKMARRSCRPERIIKKLREAEVLLSQAVAVSGVHVHAKNLGRTTYSHLYRF